jgi:hypothetical protein
MLFRETPPGDLADSGKLGGLCLWLEQLPVGLDGNGAERVSSH